MSNYFSKIFFNFLFFCTVPSVYAMNTPISLEQLIWNIVCDSIREGKRIDYILPSLLYIQIRNLVKQIFDNHGESLTPHDLRLLETKISSKYLDLIADPNLKKYLNLIKNLDVSDGIFFNKTGLDLTEQDLDIENFLAKKVAVLKTHQDLDAADLEKHRKLIETWSSSDLQLKNSENLKIEKLQNIINQFKAIRETKYKTIKGCIDSITPDARQNMFAYFILMEDGNFIGQILNYLLQKGTNPNIMVGTETALGILSSKRNNKFVKILIEHKADVNWLPHPVDQTGKIISLSPLAKAFSTQRKAANTIKEFCKDRASLLAMDPLGNNIFHYLTKSSPRDIETLMIYANFDAYSKIISKKNQQFNLAIYLLKKWYQNNIHPLNDITCKIVSYLPIEYHLHLNDTLLQELLNKGYKDLYLLGKTYKHVTWLQEIMKNRNHGGQTAFNLVCSMKGQDTLARQKYFDPYNGILAFNMAPFKESFPSILENKPDNIICKIYNKYDRTLEKKLAK